MVYELELQSADPAWWRYNIYLTLACYGADGQALGTRTAEFRTGEVVPGGMAGPPAGWKPGEAARISSAGKDENEVAAAAGYVSVVPHTLPAATAVESSPDFEAVLVARADGRELFRRVYTVNRWGGLSLAAVALE